MNRRSSRLLAGRDRTIDVALGREMDHMVGDAFNKTNIVGAFSMLKAEGGERH